MSSLITITIKDTIDEDIEISSCHKTTGAKIDVKNVKPEQARVNLNTFLDPRLLMESLHSDYQCNNCPKKFKSKSFIREHLKYCCKYLNYECPYCDFLMDKFSPKLLHHIKAEHPDKQLYGLIYYENSTNTKSQCNRRQCGPYPCRYCPSKISLLHFVAVTIVAMEDKNDGVIKINNYDKPSSAKIDVETAKPEKARVNLNTFLDPRLLMESLHSDFQCNNCPKKFKTKSLIREHLKYCCKYLDYQCPYCDFRIDEFSLKLLHHMKAEHPNRRLHGLVNYENSTNSKNPFTTNSRGRYSCSFCPNRYKELKNLKHHLKVMCLFVDCSGFAEELNRSVVYFYPPVTPKQVPTKCMKEKKFKCDECPGLFSTKYRLDYHKKKECKAEKTFSCSYCNYKSKWNAHQEQTSLCHAATDNGYLVNGTSGPGGGYHNQYHHQHFPTIRVRNVASISLREMERLGRHHGHGTLLENPFKSLARRRNQVRHAVEPPAMLSTSDFEPPEPPRPSNAVATVLQQQDTNCRAFPANLYENGLLENGLLRPVKIEPADDYFKRKRGYRQEVKFQVLQNFELKKLAAKNKAATAAAAAATTAATAAVTPEVRAKIKIEPTDNDIVVKKKPGRPRKHPIKIETFPKRKRGRPKKNISKQKFEVEIKKEDFTKRIEPGTFFNDEIFVTRLRSKRL
ncbi:hypothetical protein TKK_0011276 [Trichogramma kaykai]